MIAKSFFDTVPVKVVWSLRSSYCLKNTVSSTEKYELMQLYEGKRYQVILNKHERNPLARRLCIEHYGHRCQICNFDFFSTYGDLGKDFIHVHHVIPVSEIGENYQMDPIKDLIPICPNCHAIIHRYKETMSVETIKNIIS